MQYYTRLTLEEFLLRIDNKSFYGLTRGRQRKREEERKGERAREQRQLTQRFEREREEPVRGRETSGQREEEGSVTAGDRAIEEADYREAAGEIKRGEQRAKEGLAGGGGRGAAATAFRSAPRLVDDRFSPIFQRVERSTCSSRRPANTPCHEPVRASSSSSSPSSSSSSRRRRHARNRLHARTCVLVCGRT